MFGRNLFGLAAVGFGICGFVWPDVTLWKSIDLFGNIPHAEILLYLTSAIAIAGGLLIQWPRTAHAGAVALGAVYLFFVLLALPHYVRNPLAFDYVPAITEELSLLCGALIVYGGRFSRIGYYGFGICVIFFALAQVVYLQYTASLVPKWIPPGQIFWTNATTAFFALAALALLTGRAALLASRLLTAMIVGFGLLVWVPACATHPHVLSNWTEIATNFSIAGAAWIVADYLAKKGSSQAY
ncbi:MAG TPA: hypothetical protein VMG98_00775 [Verrucomicrobiae bacterium]|nr:hypothetical protein [Verrucomicrobiae bacterium]